MREIIDKGGLVYLVGIPGRLSLRGLESRLACKLTYTKFENVEVAYRNACNAMKLNEIYTHKSHCFNEFYNNTL